MSTRLHSRLLAHLCAFVLLLVASSGAFAQSSVRTETIKPPAAAAATDQGRPTGKLTPLTENPEIITDLSRLPPTVAQTRERILAAARSGDLAKVAALIRTDETVFTFSDDTDPVAFWQTNYPDSEGLEALAILINLLETGFVRIDAGTPQEMYVWPYFVRMQLKTLTPPQKVELFRIVTGSDFKDMLDFGAYAFYRVGIGAKGTWHYFVAGD
jgi:hypothetical protein